MKTSTIGLALLSLAGFSYAAPRSNYINARQASSSDTLEVFFFGAGSNPPSFEQDFPNNGSVEAITNTLSISNIFVGGIGECVFTGLDGSSTLVGGGTSENVGPPQPQVSGFCFGDP